MAGPIDSTVQAVVATYQRELPSVHFLEDAAEFRRRKTMRENHFRFALNFPPEMFAGRRLLDLGGGTGENTVFYALWGADCTVVDANPVALERAQRIFEAIAADSRPKFRHASIFEIDEPGQYDIVISDGVCHHTSDKCRCFEILASSVRRGGYCYFGIGSATGQLQRNIQRLILYRFAASDDDYVALAERLFPEHLDRAARFGQRSKRAVVFDTFINPKHDLVHVASVLKWFKDNGLKLYSSYPKIGVPFACDGPDRGTYLDSSTNPLLGVIPELFWMAHSMDDAEIQTEYFAAAGRLSPDLYGLGETLNNLGPESKPDIDTALKNCRALRDGLIGIDRFGSGPQFVLRFLGELEAILSTIASGDLDAIEAQIKRGQSVFRGPHGVGLIYFVGYKP